MPSRAAKFGEDHRFAPAESAFAFEFEDQRHVGAAMLFDGVVEIEKRQAEQLRGAAADGGFAGAHRADEKQVRSGIHASMLADGARGNATMCRRPTC